MVGCVAWQARLLVLSLARSVKRHGERLEMKSPTETFPVKEEQPHAKPDYTSSN